MPPDPARLVGIGSVEGRPTYIVQTDREVGVDTKYRAISTFWIDATDFLPRKVYWRDVDHAGVMEYRRFNDDLRIRGPGPCPDA